MANIQEIFGDTVKTGDKIRFTRDGHVEVDAGGRKNFQESPQAMKALQNYLAQHIDPMHRHEVDLLLYAFSSHEVAQNIPGLSADDWADFMGNLILHPHIDALIDAGRIIHTSGVHRLANDASRSPIPTDKQLLAMSNKTSTARPFSPKPAAMQTAAPESWLDKLGANKGKIIAGAALLFGGYACHPKNPDAPEQPPASHVQNLDAETPAQDSPSR